MWGIKCAAFVHTSSHCCYKAFVCLAIIDFFTTHKNILILSTHPVVLLWRWLKAGKEDTDYAVSHRQLPIKSAQTGSTIVLECTNEGHKEGRSHTESIREWGTADLGERDAWHQRFSLPFLRGVEKSLACGGHWGHWPLLQEVIQREEHRLTTWGFFIVINRESLWWSMVKSLKSQ